VQFLGAVLLRLLGLFCVAVPPGLYCVLSRYVLCCFLSAESKAGMT